MNSKSDFIDFREEMYVALYRRWLVVDLLGKDKNGNDVLTIQKGALFDYLLKNPKDMHSFLVSFQRLHENSPYEDILYKNDAEFGAYQDVSEFLQSMLLLESSGYIEINKIGVEFYLISKTSLADINTTQVENWKSSLSLLKPLVGKSLNILQKNSLR
ncbi:hypothetical protein GNZ06_04225 [Aeromonas jandaei]|uniref:hypothetical protein n=1 Tax=Aeromonas TaxID=642 RepID=UPI0019328FAC|nr:MULTISPECIES: hypothetical protein [Aeromonas]MBM0491461.1 hypothetical protein [Aeromonas jandaei]MBM0568005.1 hypothetical protein [Aeromonas jandaei]